MRLYLVSLLLGLIISLISPSSLYSQLIHGELFTWHKVIIDFEGPSSSEYSIPNPFSDYRLDVLFTGPSNQTFRVPGFFSADGNASESSADSGNIWRVLFSPNEAGEWSFTTSFVQGEFIAAQLEGGESAGYFDGTTGTFQIVKQESLPVNDFRSKGKLEYVGEHYLKFSESNEFFLKAGANSPEVFLEYQEFDNTPSNRVYESHIQDFDETNDPTWQNGKGKGIIGVVNYLSSIGINSHYFLMMNAYGDGKNAWPWVHQDSMYVYDVSKLDQWEIVFEHMTKKGVMPHFVLTETENESYFELKEHGVEGGFANSRKIYYREMIARFGHHPAITWNIGEENGWEDPSTSIYRKGNTDQQRIDAANYIRSLTHYNDHISIHNGPSWDDSIFNALVGTESLTGPAYQWDLGIDIHSKILEWRQKSIEMNHNWVINMDEAYVNPPTGSLTSWAKDANWGTFLAGGAGVELYIGAGLDLSIENYREYEQFFTKSVGIKNIIETLPFAEMLPMDSLASRGWVFGKTDSLYVYYKTSGGNSTLILPDGNYHTTWINPQRLEYATETTPNIIGGDTVTIGGNPFGLFAEGVLILTKIDSVGTNNQNQEEKSTSFRLGQNYPNPFNPNTIIEYQVASASFVSIVVYDSIGREIQTLVDSFKTANVYNVTFNSANLPSGLYFYQLVMNNEVISTRKMVIAK